MGMSAWERTRVLPSRDASQDRDPSLGHGFEQAWMEAAKFLLPLQTWFSLS